MKKQAERPLFSGIATFSLCIFALGFSPAVLAQNPPGNPGSTTPSPRTSGTSHVIRGKIYLPSGGLPEQRIRVVLELSTGGIAGETFSDSVGNFEFRSLPSNSYKVIVPSDSSQSFDTTQEVVEVFGTFSRTFSVQIFLKEKDSGIVFKPKDRLITPADMQEIPKPAKKAYEKGVKKAQDRKPDQAIVFLQEALKIYPEYLYAMNKLGEQYLMLKQFDDAQATLERAIAASPKFALPHINLGLVMINKNRFADAIQHFENGNRLDDGFPMSHLNLGLALMSIDPPDFDRAEKEMSRAIQMGGREMAYARKYMFNLYVRRQDMNKAAEQLDAYLKDMPDAPDSAEVRQLLSKVKKMIAQKNQQPKN